MTKVQLRVYRDIKLERDKLKDLAEGLAYGPSGLRLDGMPRSNKLGDSTGQQAIDHTQVIDQYLDKVAELDRALIEIEAAIKCLEPRERTLIRLYYLEGLTWEEVCVAMSYSWRQIHNIHAKALEKLKEV